MLVSCSVLFDSSPGRFTIFFSSVERAKSLFSRRRIGVAAQFSGPSRCLIRSSVLLFPFLPVPTRSIAFSMKYSVFSVNPKISWISCVSWFGCFSVVLKNLSMFGLFAFGLYFTGSLLKYILFGVNGVSSLVFRFRIPFSTIISLGLLLSKNSFGSVYVSASILFSISLAMCVVYASSSMFLMVSFM